MLDVLDQQIKLVMLEIEPANFAGVLVSQCMLVVLEFMLDSTIILKTLGIKYSLSLYFKLGK